MFFFDSATDDQFINKLLVEAVAKEWPHVLGPLSNQAIRTSSLWPSKYKIPTYPIRHEEIAEICLDLLLSANCLSKQDICQLGTPGVLRNEIDKQVISHHLPSEIQYACCYWTRHLRASNSESRSIEDCVYEFLSRRFLFWFEAVSLIGRVPEMSKMIQDLAELFPKRRNFDLGVIVDQIMVFFENNKDKASLAPLQIYYSIIFFHRGNSDFIGGPGMTTRLIKLPKTLDIVEYGTRGDGMSTRLIGIRSMTFSPDGKILASASHDQKILIWNTNPEYLKLTLIGHACPVDLMIFSPDGNFLASASSDRTVILWNLTSEAGSIKRIIANGGFNIQFSFKNDLLQLHTDKGSFDIGALPMEIPEKMAETISRLTIEDDWLVRDGQRFIWLPLDAQFAYCRGLMAFSFPGQDHIILLEMSFDEYDRLLREDTT